jgi:tol-pal system protein YbgF
LRAELRSLQEENARLARRVERLEAGHISPAAGPREVPSLTVVKLKPKQDPAPKLSVSQPVVEPDVEVVAEILDAPSSGSSRAQSGSGADNPSLDAEFGEGLAALRTGNVSGGIARLQRFASQNPRHPKADNALYFAGVGQMAQSDFEAAAGTFERLLSSYPASDEAQAAMLKLAECRVRLKNAREARAVYTQVVNKYPGSAATNEATQRLAALPP